MKNKINSINNWMNERWKPILIALLSLQFVGLMATLIGTGVGLNGDAREYITIAENFKNTGMMLDASDNPIFFRTPGYPFILAVIYLFTGGSNTAVALLQIAEAILISVFLFVLVSKHTQRSFGLYAVLFYISDLVVYGLTVSVLTDLPFSFLFILGIFLIDKYISDKRELWLILCAVIFIADMLLRPTSMYLNMVFIVIGIVLSVMKRLPWKPVILFTLLFTVVFGGWSYRNYTHYGVFSYTSIRSESVYMWYAPLLYQAEEDASEEEAKEYFETKLIEAYPHFYESDRTTQIKAYEEVGSAYVDEHKPGYLMMNVYGLFREMFAPGVSRLESMGLKGPGLLLVELFVSGMLTLLYLIYAVGFFANIKRLRWYDWSVLLTSMYFMASTAVLGYSRYRLAFYPLCILGAFLVWKSRIRFTNQSE